MFDICSKPGGSLCGIMIVFITAHLLCNSRQINFHIDFWSIKTWDAIFVTWYFGQMVAFWCKMSHSTDKYGKPINTSLTDESAIRVHKYWCRAANSFHAHQISHSVCSLLCTFIFYPEVLTSSFHSVQHFVRAVVHVAPFVFMTLEVFFARIPIRVSYMMLFLIWWYIVAINIGTINILRTSTTMLTNVGFGHFDGVIYPYASICYLVPLVIVGQAGIVFGMHIVRHYAQSPIVPYECNPHSVNQIVDKVGHGQF